MSACIFERNPCILRNILYTFSLCELAHTLRSAMSPTGQTVRSKIQVGRRRTAVLHAVGFILVTIFTVFEVAHPAGDLLHAAAHHSDSSPGSSAIQTDDLPRDGSHGPFVAIALDPPAQPTQIAMTEVPAVSSQESQPPDPPLHVPIPDDASSVCS